MDDARRCTATSKQTGQRCKRAAIPGGRVCSVHGGSAPQTREAARLRLLRAADPAAAELVKLTRHDDATVRLRSSVAVLDRAGLGKVAGLEVSGTVTVQAERIVAVLTGVLADLGQPMDDAYVRELVVDRLRVAARQHLAPIPSDG